MNNIFLTVTVGPDYRLLPKFLRYYRTLGIENFLVILNTSEEGAYNILRDFGIVATDIWLDPFSEVLKQSHERAAIVRHCSKDDWVLYTDLDEFQVYPKGLKACLRYCLDNSIDFLEGRMIDRISSTGELVEIKDHRDLEEQFPLGGYITNALLGAWDKKIVLSKANLIIGGGHHVFLDEKTYEPLPYRRELNKHSKGIRVHHFKWDSKALNRMKYYLSLADESLYYWKKEISTFLKYYKEHNKIDITEKRFKIKKINDIINI